jgi:hypothetical protein
MVVHSRAVGRSENPGVPVLFDGNNLPHLVEKGLTDLQKYEGVIAPPAPPGTTGLHSTRACHIRIHDFKMLVEQLF